MTIKIQKVKVLVGQSCPTLWHPMDYSSPSSSVYGILQVRIQEWAAIPFSRGSFWPRDWTQVSWIAHGFFTVWAIFIILNKLSWTSCNKFSSPIPGPRKSLVCFPSQIYICIYERKLTVHTILYLASFAQHNIFESYPYC